MVRVCEQPGLFPGEDGAFDDCGAMIGWLLPVGDELWLYYQGWNRGVRVPFYNNIGLAASNDGGFTFRRKSRGPIIPRDDVDPIFTATPCVLVEDDIFHLWYLSALEWEQTDAGPRHRYDLRFAQSRDGISWTKWPEPILTFDKQDEYAISRPCVLKTVNGYAMWFSSRGDHYRIGYAESPNGIKWTRRPYGGLDISDKGWDSEMVEYPHVFESDSRLYMLYNGNGYGATGIGLAIAEGHN